jgi:hypothetical protein
MYQKISSPSTYLEVYYNQFVCKEATQYAQFEYSYTTTEMQNWGMADHNYYARPIDDDYVFYYSGNHTLAEWKTLVSPDEVHSLGSPSAVSSVNDIHFIYNETYDTKYYDLSATMEDITGVEYSGSVSLGAWTAKILLGVGTVTESEGETGANGFLKAPDGTHFLKTSSGKFLKY